MALIDNMYTITAVSWKADGSKLALGSVCGALELYDACLRQGELHLELMIIVDISTKANSR